MQAINTKKFAQNAFKLDVSRTKKAMTINRTSAPNVKLLIFYIAVKRSFLVLFGGESKHCNYAVK